MTSPQNFKAPKLAAASQWELDSARFLWEGMCTADFAHTLALRQAKLISPKVCAQLLKGLRQIENAYPQRRKLDLQLGDIYKNREKWLAEAVPNEAGWLALGRTRREVTTIAFYIAVRDRVLELQSAIAGLAGVLISIAQENTETYLPDYSYLQPAQVTTFAHYILSFVYPMLRDLERLEEALARHAKSPAGPGSMTGSALPIDRVFQAKILGFRQPITHTRDAVWRSDFPLEIAGHGTIAAANLSRLADDFIVWNTKEFNGVTFSDRVSRASVLMPQKKNPYALSFVRGTYGVVIGKLVSVATTSKTATSQVDNRIFAYSEVPEALELVRTAALMAKEVFAGLKINIPILRQRAEKNFMQAADMAEKLTQTAKIDYLSAHERIASVIAKLNSDASFVDFFTELKSQSPGVILRQAEFSKLWHPKTQVQSRSRLGGAAPSAVKKMIADTQRQLKSATQKNQKNRDRVRTARINLEKLIAAGLQRG